MKGALAILVSMIGVALLVLLLLNRIGGSCDAESALPWVACER